MKDELTPLEYEITSLVALGWRKRSIAVRLEVTREAINARLKIIRDKTGMDNHYELAMRFWHERSNACQPVSETA